MSRTIAAGRLCGVGLLLCAALLAGACLNDATAEETPGCTDDSQCKHGRRCVDGSCVGEPEGGGGTGWGGSGWGGSGGAGGAGPGGSGGGGSGGAGGIGGSAGGGGAGGRGEPGREDCERACEALSRCGLGDPGESCADGCLESLPVMGEHAWDCLDCLETTRCRNIPRECGNICQ